MIAARVVIGGGQVWEMGSDGKVGQLWGMRRAGWMGWENGGSYEVVEAPEIWWRFGGGLVEVLWYAKSQVISKTRA